MIGIFATFSDENLFLLDENVVIQTDLESHAVIKREIHFFLCIFYMLK